jgi:penicillin amidase
LWARGEYFPLVYSRKAVEKESREKVELVPQ